MRATLTTGLAALTLSACTTQLSSLAPPSGQGTEPVTGVSYRLARLDYSLTVTRTLTACPTPGKGTLEVVVAAVAVPAYGPSEEVVIDYGALANGWKTTSVALETFPNGVLKSVNAQVSDQTGPASLDFGSDTAAAVAAQGALKALIDRATATVDFRPTGTALATNSVPSAAACGTGRGRSPCGILYRSVTPARLQVCRYSEQLADCGSRPAGDPLVLVRDERNAPQLGGLRSLPLRNGPFETNSLVAVFREDSSLSTVAYAKPTAGGVAAIGALGDVVTGATEVDSFARGRALRRLGNQTSRSEAETDLANAQTAAVEAELKRREAQAKLDALNGAPDEEDQ